MSVTLESKRAQVAYEWLKKSASECSVDKLTTIRNNSPSWLGTAHTPEIEALLESVIEAKSGDNPEVLKKLFESPTPIQAQTQTTQGEASATPRARAPVVAPMNISGGISGSANYGNISGPTFNDNRQTNIDVDVDNRNINQTTNINNSPNANVDQSAKQPGDARSPASEIRNMRYDPTTQRGLPNRSSNNNQNANINNSPGAAINQGAGSGISQNISPNR